MATFTTIEAEARERAGKGAARASRRAGKVPAVIYGAKSAPTLIQLEPKALLKELHRGGWRSRVYDVKLGEEPTRTLIREVQFHPVTDAPIHVDFQRLAPGQRIRVAVAIHFINEAISPGLKKGGVLNVVRHTVDVLADPEAVPENLVVDLAKLDIADTVHWSEIPGNEALAPIATGRDLVIATIAPPVKGAEPAADAAAAAPAKGKAAGKPAAKK